MLSSGFAAVLELPFDKRRLFNVLHSVAAGDEVREGVVRLQDYARRASAAAPLRILVADDNPTNREVIGRILERGGHAVTLVNDGEQVLDAFERDTPDLVVLDRNMPGMGGLEALQALRLMTRGRERVPVIMLSADVTTETKREALESGADAFLAKPIETLRLLDEIQALATPKAAAGRKAEPRLVHARPAASAAPAVLNADTLQHLEELGSSLAFVEKLVGVFVADSTVMLERIEKVLAGRDYHEFRSLLHAMKGSSASIGTDRLTSLCERLAKLSDGELRLQASALHRKLADEMGEARRQLEHHIHERRKSVG
jgi:two-component system sensor histidine kinase RpfC